MFLFQCVKLIMNHSSNPTALLHPIYLRCSVYLLQQTFNQSLNRTAIPCGEFWWLPHIPNGVPGEAGGRRIACPFWQKDHLKTIEIGKSEECGFGKMNITRSHCTDTYTVAYPR